MNIPYGKIEELSIPGMKRFLKIIKKYNEEIEKNKKK